MACYIWLAEAGFYFEVPELSPQIFGPFSSVLRASELAYAEFVDRTSGLEQFRDIQLELVAAEPPVRLRTSN